MMSYNVLALLQTERKYFSCWDELIWLSFWDRKSNLPVYFWKISISFWKPFCSLQSIFTYITSLDAASITLEFFSMDSSNEGYRREELCPRSSWCKLWTWIFNLGMREAVSFSRCERLATLLIRGNVLQQVNNIHFRWPGISNMPLTFTLCVLKQVVYPFHDSVSLSGYWV